MMCLLLLYDVEKIGYGTWLTKLTVRLPSLYLGGACRS